MKLTPEEYLKVLHRRNEIELTPEEVKYVKEERLKEHTEWSTYLHSPAGRSAPRHVG